MIRIPGNPIPIGAVQVARAGVARFEGKTFTNATQYGFPWLNECFEYFDIRLNTNFRILCVLYHGQRSDDVPYMRDLASAKAALEWITDLQKWDDL